MPGTGAKTEKAQMFAKRLITYAHHCDGQKTSAYEHFLRWQL